jgi:hypothetical protein
MSDEEQANLSAREVALRTKDKMLLMGFHSPDTTRMWGLMINHYTTFFYSTPGRREAHAHKFLADPENKDFKLVYLNPKVK